MFTAGHYIGISSTKELWIIKSEIYYRYPISDEESLCLAIS